jgi:hypothetical protein
MTDWIIHDGGPQPVDDDVWVYVADVLDLPDEYYHCEAQDVDWPHAKQYRILNQHLIDAAISIFQAEIPKLCDAARLEGIRLGLEAAAKEADVDWFDPASRSQARLTVANIRALDPETIAKDAKPPA